ncbi:hypothetical protein BH10ACI4_BH10ACI4_06820 [soil metagenome]
MSPSKAARPTHAFTHFLLIALCFTCVLWRVNVRVGQYDPASARRPIPSVALVNPIEPADDSSIQLQWGSPNASSEQPNSLTSLPLSTQPDARTVRRNRPSGKRTLPSILIYAAPLFVNPPPPSSLS